MDWVKYDLYREVKTQNEIGQLKIEYRYVGKVDVIINNVIYSNVVGDLVYRKIEPTAITKKKDFDLKANYKLTKDNNSYMITGINQEGRYAQLLLNQVV